MYINSEIQITIHILNKLSIVSQVNFWHMKFKKQMFVSGSNGNYFIEKIIHMVKFFFKTLLFNIFGFIFFSFSILKYFLIQYKILILEDFFNFHFGKSPFVVVVAIWLDEVKIYMIKFGKTLSDLTKFKSLFYPKNINLNIIKLHPLFEL